jgi:hypothetical protein
MNLLQTHKHAARLRYLRNRSTAATIPAAITDRPVSIHFRKTAQSPIVLDHRRGQGLISAHALSEDLSVSSARWTSAAPSTSQKPSRLGGFM